MQNKYLEILELSPGATKSDVKKAYRRLSKIYHPDISKDENAKDKFIEIVEAYNFLNRVGPTPHQEPVSYDYNPHVNEYDSWRARARAAAKRKAQEAQRRQTELMKAIIGTFNYVATIILLFNLLLAIDFFLPPQHHDEEIVGMSRIYEYSRNGRRSNYKYKEVYFENFTMRFDKNQNVNVQNYEKAVVIASNILKKPISLVITINGKEYTHDQLYGIYKTYGFLIPAMFIIVFSYSFLLPLLDHKLTLAILMVFVFVFQIMLFLKF